VGVGTTTILTCVGFSDPTSSVIWNMEGAEVNNDSRISIYEQLLTVNDVNWVLSNLVICGVDYADGGQYSCTVGNAMMNASVTFEISVNIEGGIYITFRTML